MNRKIYPMLASLIDGFQRLIMHKKSFQLTFPEIEITDRLLKLEGRAYFNI